MKCSASQTTSSANSALHHDTPLSAADSARLHEVATQFEAVLVSVALKPAMKALGPMGDIVGQQLATKIAAPMSEPLFEQLRSEIG